VRQQAEVAFPFPGCVRAASQGGTEKPFVPREGALHLPALPIFSRGEAMLHLPPVLGLRPIDDHSPAML
jgi:hypothetical protein